MLRQDPEQRSWQNSASSGNCFVVTKNMPLAMDEQPVTLFLADILILHLDYFMI